MLLNVVRLRKRRRSGRQFGTCLAKNHVSLIDVLQGLSNPLRQVHESVVL